MKSECPWGHIGCRQWLPGARNRVEIAIWAHQTGQMRARTNDEGI